MNVKYLKDGSEFLDFEVKTELAGFISILKESEYVQVNSESFILERFEIKTLGTDNEVFHQLLVFLKRKVNEF